MFDDDLYYYVKVKIFIPGYKFEKQLLLAVYILSSNKVWFMYKNKKPSFSSRLSATSTLTQ